MPLFASEKNFEWWSANRDKIYKVGLESHKVEHRWTG